MIGKTISHYKITGELGRGGMGIVYKAEDLTLKRTVALKFLSPHLLADPDQKARFLHEAQAAAALEHPNISTIHEIHEEDGHTFMVMAYIEGEDLGTRIAEGHLSVSEALDITIQVAKGISKAHTAGIVHRDIKPGNVLITPDGTVKVVDFGLAKLATQTKLTKTGTTMGTVRYMSPEQARGDEVDHRTDIWSVGVMLYEMLAGELPFRGEAEPAMFYSILNEDPKPVTEMRKDIPIGLEDTIEKALAKDPTKRYQTMDELLSDLEMQRDKVTLGIKERQFTAWRRLKRRKRLSVGMAAVIILAAAAFIIQTFHSKSMAIDSIAVLPLDNLSGDSNQEYMIEGISADLINNLSQISGFSKVISWASTKQYIGTDKSPGEIARELDVKAIIAGRMQHMEEELTFGVELIQAATGKILWAHTYTTDIKNIQAIYQEVTYSVTEAINLELTLTEKSLLAGMREIDPDAYDAYLKGRHLYNMLEPEKLKLSLDQYNRAVEIDSSYALAYVGLADSWMALGQIDPDISWGAGLEKAREYAHKALEIDDALAEANAKLAEVIVESEFDWVSAEKLYKKALQLDPRSASAHILYSQLLSLTNRHDEAIEHMLRAEQLSPLEAFTLMNVIGRYQQAGRNEESIKAYRQAIQLIPNNPMIHWIGSFPYMALRQYDNALSILEKCNSLPEAKLHIAYCKVRLGNQTAATTFLDGKNRDDYPLDFAAVYMGLGEIDQALECVMKMGYGADLAWAQIDPVFQDLVSDPHFREWMRQINFPGYE